MASNSATLHHIIDACDQGFEILSFRRIKRIEPTHIVEIKKKVAPGRRFGQPHRENCTSGVESMRDFSFYMRRRIGII
jgi:hypothetical protein